MRGEVLIYDPATGYGLVSGADNERYGLSAADLMQPITPKPGQQVDFVAEDGRATQVVVIEPRPNQIAPVLYDTEQLDL